MSSGREDEKPQQQQDPEEDQIPTESLNDLAVAGDGLAGGGDSNDDGDENMLFNNNNNNNNNQSGSNVENVQENNNNNNMGQEGASPLPELQIFSSGDEDNNDNNGNDDDSNNNNNNLDEDEEGHHHHHESKSGNKNKFALPLGTTFQSLFGNQYAPKVHVEGEEKFPSKKKLFDPIDVDFMRALEECFEIVIPGIDLNQEEGEEGEDEDEDDENADENEDDNGDVNKKKTKKKKKQKRDIPQESAEEKELRFQEELLNLKMLLYVPQQQNQQQNRFDPESSSASFINDFDSNTMCLSTQAQEQNHKMLEAQWERLDAEEQYAYFCTLFGDKIAREILKEIRNKGMDAFEGKKNVGLVCLPRLPRVNVFKNAPEHTFSPNATEDQQRLQRPHQDAPPENWLLHMPTIFPNRRSVHISQQPYDPANAAIPGALRKQSDERSIFTPLNVVRWAYEPSKHKNLSNARLVKWSGGSWTLHIGTDVYSIASDQTSSLAVVGTETVLTGDSINSIQNTSSFGKTMESLPKKDDNNQNQNNNNNNSTRVFVETAPYTMRAQLLPAAGDSGQHSVESFLVAENRHRTLQNSEAHVKRTLTNHSSIVMKPPVGGLSKDDQSKRIDAPAEIVDYLLQQDKIREAQLKSRKQDKKEPVTLFDRLEFDMEVTKLATSALENGNMDVLKEQQAADSAADQQRRLKDAYAKQTGRSLPSSDQDDDEDEDEEEDDDDSDDSDKKKKKKKKQKEKSEKDKKKDKKKKSKKDKKKKDKKKKKKDKKDKKSKKDKKDAGDDENQQEGDEGEEGGVAAKLSDLISNSSGSGSSSSSATDNTQKEKHHREAHRRSRDGINSSNNDENQGEEESSILRNEVEELKLTPGLTNDQRNQIETSFASFEDGNISVSQIRKELKKIKKQVVESQQQDDDDEAEDGDDGGEDPQ